MQSKAFVEHYRKLNPKQKEAVDAIEGPVMVIAGPGTGKTQILTLRIGNILQKTDTSPDSILAITFTESGVYSMRKRLVEIMGSTAYRVNIYTFHSFCNDIIRNYPEEFPQIIGGQNISEIDQIKLIEEIIKKTKLERLKPFGDIFYFVKPIIGAIRILKREAVSNADFVKVITNEQKHFEKITDKIYKSGRFKGEMKGVFKEMEKQLIKNKELSIVYSKYEEILRSGRFYDYEDMIIEVVRVLEKNRNLLLSLQEQYQYILADEHQDANTAQNKILELLSSFHDSPNLFIVGDEKQAIFRFQGASLENFLHFKKLYSKALLIALTDNYRSTQQILNAAHSLIGERAGGERVARPLLMAKEKENGALIKFFPFSKQKFELQYLVNDIKLRIKKGAPPQSIAVLYRENKDARPIIDIFERTNIPFIVESDLGALSDQDITKFTTLLRAVQNPTDDTILGKLLFFDFFGISSIDAYKILRKSHNDHIPIVDLISSYKRLREIKLKEPKKIVALSLKLGSWVNAAHNRSLIDFFESIVRESGFLKHLLTLPGSMEKLRKLDAVLTEARKLVESNRRGKLQDFIGYLDVLENYKILVKTKGSFSIPEAVRLMTAHKSKGLEFEYVYITGCYDGHWGNRAERNLFNLPIFKDSKLLDPNEDERRLFYVALTRAKTEVLLTLSSESENGRHQIPSQFIAEIDKTLLDEINTSNIEINIRKQKTFFFKDKINYGVNISDKKFLRKLFLEQGLAVTGLNNYLACPWKYFFINLIRIPQAQTKYQIYGTAIHESLHHFFQAISKGTPASSRNLLASFELHLRRQALSLHDFEEMLAKGRKALSGYFSFYKKKFIHPSITEYNIGGVLLPVVIKGKKINLTIKGKLDKLEILGDEKKVNVVDYKTGKPKTRNDIEGKTKESGGDYKRQLIFYRLLLDLSPKSKFKFASAEIDFIEPDQKSRYHKEKFIITDGEVKALTELIKKTGKEIFNLSFFNKECGDKTCKYCALRKLITRSVN